VHFDLAAFGRNWSVTFNEVDHDELCWGIAGWWVYEGLFHALNVGEEAKVRVNAYGVVD
jgi:hypothetical protein